VSPLFDTARPTSFISSGSIPLPLLKFLSSGASATLLRTSKKLQMVAGQNGSGQNGMDKIEWTKWYRPYGQNGIRHNGMGKMVRTEYTKW